MAKNSENRADKSGLHFQNHAISSKGDSYIVYANKIIFLPRPSHLLYIIHFMDPFPMCTYK